MLPACARCRPACAMHGVHDSTCSLCRGALASSCPRLHAAASVRSAAGLAWMCLGMHNKHMCARLPVLTARAPAQGLCYDAVHARWFPGLIVAVVTLNMALLCTTWRAPRSAQHAACTQRSVTAAAWACMPLWHGLPACMPCAAAALWHVPVWHPACCIRPSASSCKAVCLSETWHLNPAPHSGCRGGLPGAPDIATPCAGRGGNLTGCRMP